MRMQYHNICEYCITIYDKTTFQQWKNKEGVVKLTNDTFATPLRIWKYTVSYWTLSFNSAPGLNLMALRAAISMGCFVFGLTPLRAAFSVTENEPKPRRAIFPPAFISSDTVSTKASTAYFATALLKPDFSATAVINSVLFMMDW